MFRKATAALTLTAAVATPTLANQQFACASTPGPRGSMTFVVTGTVFGGAAHVHENGQVSVMVEPRSRAASMDPLIVVCANQASPGCLSLNDGDFVTLTGDIIPQECAEWLPNHKLTQPVRFRATDVFVHH